MEYSKIVSVSGLPGLYELINSKQDGAIVRSLDDKTTKFASSRVHNFSHLESIEIYTTGENVNLIEVFQAMEKTADALPDIKDDGTIKKYFEKVYPEIDFERVYSSDLKKMVKWFEVLRKNNIEIKLPEPEPEEIENEEQPEPEKSEEKKVPPKQKGVKEEKKSSKRKTEEKAEKKSSSKTSKTEKKSGGKKAK